MGTGTKPTTESWTRWNSPGRNGWITSFDHLVGFCKVNFKKAEKGPTATERETERLAMHIISDMQVGKSRSLERC